MLCAHAPVWRLKDPEEPARKFLKFLTLGKNRFEKFEASF